MKPTSAIDLFVSRDRQSKIWFILLVIATAGFAWERQRLITSLTHKPQVIVMDQNTYYLPKLVDFEQASDLHVSQTLLAAEALFNRHPGGPDNPAQLKRLYDEDTLATASKAIEAEASEFAAKHIHQKVELGPIQILQVRDHSVLTAAQGQLIRTGRFEGKHLVEVLELKIRFKFVLNKDMSSNGRFPTIVTDYDVITKQLPHHG